MLWHEVLSVDHLVKHLIAELIAKHIDDGRERPPLVVAYQILDVLEQKRLWLLLGKDSGNIEEEGSLGLVRESVWSTQRILFRNPCD